MGRKGGVLARLDLSLELTPKQEAARLADLLQPEDPLVYGGEVLHAV